MTRAFFALIAIVCLAATTFSTSRQAAAAKVCSENYLPVCAVDGAGTRRTYSNACFARQAGAKVLHPGACFGTFCFRIYEPVCAIDPVTRHTRTYSNLCEAEKANAIWLRNGTCRRR
jgi:hypothetical protein